MIVTYEMWFVTTAHTEVDGKTRREEIGAVYHTKVEFYSVVTHATVLHLLYDQEFIQHEFTHDGTKEIEPKITSPHDGLIRVDTGGVILELRRTS